MVFSRRRRDLICTQNNNRKVKNIFGKSEHTVKSTSFWLENVVLRDKYCQKIEENEPEKPKNVKLLITDYAKVKKKDKHDKNKDFKSRTLSVGGERCPIALFESFVERKPLLNLYY